jgi:hypothetical protein
VFVLLFIIIIIVFRVVFLIIIIISSSIAIILVIAIIFLGSVVVVVVVLTRLGLVVMRFGFRCGGTRIFITTNTFFRRMRMSSGVWDPFLPCFGS